MSTDRIIEEVTRTSISLLLKEPFYSHFFSALNKEVVQPGSVTKTMAVGLRERIHTLYINPDFWDNFLTSKDHRYGVVKHEILHIVFKHTLENDKSIDRHVANIAMDIVVNQYIDKLLLPAESIFIEDFPELNFEKDHSWRYYYHKLLDLRDNLDTRYKDTQAASVFASIKENSHGLDRHVTWEEVYLQPGTEHELVKIHIDNLLNIAHNKTPLKSYGSLPAGLKAYLESILIKPKPLVDWRRVIKLFSESSSKTKVKNTIRRPSKRFGTVPGIKIRKMKKLLVAVDTSGSISGQELAQFFNEIYHIWRQGAVIKIVECDAVVQNVYSYKGIAPGFVKGRGGTDFDPVIAYGNKEFLPDGLIYFTDGIAPAPKNQPRFPLLWVISSNGILSEEFSKFPGRKAKLLS
jgi:predicted metal-dependent peptidase